MEQKNILRAINVGEQLEKEGYMNYNLRGARLCSGYSALQLAKLVGVTGSTIYAYEALRCLPSPERAQKIAEALDKPLDYFFPTSLQSIARDIRNERRLKHSLHISLDDICPENLAFDEEDPSVRADRNLLMDKMKSALAAIAKKMPSIKLRYGVGNGKIYTLEESDGLFRATTESL